MEKNYETNNFAKNLRYLRQRSGMTQEQLGEKIGVKRINITAWENGKTIPNKFETLKKITDLFKVTFDSLVFEDVRLSSTYYSIDPKIIIYGEVSIDDGVETFKKPIEKITNPYHQIQKGLFGIKVNRDSMNNIIKEGMYAIIEKKETINSGEIAFVSIDNGIGVLKRVIKVDESTILLRPDSSNENHKTMIFEKGDISRLKILGRYIGYVSPTTN